MPRTTQTARTPPRRPPRRAGRRSAIAALHLAGANARADGGQGARGHHHALALARPLQDLDPVVAADPEAQRPPLDAVPDDALRRARETLGAAIVASEELSGAAGAALESGARAAFVEGVHTAAIAASVATLLVAAWAAVTRLRDGGD